MGGAFGNIIRRHAAASAGSTLSNHINADGSVKEKPQHKPVQQQEPEIELNYQMLQENKVHLYGLDWKEEQYVEQYLTGIKANYSKLGSDFFIYKNNLSGVLDHLLRVG